MVRFVFILLFCCAVLFFFLHAVKEGVRKDLAQPVVSQLSSEDTPTPFFEKQKKGIKKESLFVPYWAVPEVTLPGTYTTYIYFGVTPGQDGLFVDEPGSQQIDAFLSVVPEQKEKLLTLRMVDNQNNLTVLKSDRLQQKIIEQTLSLVKEKGFDGVVLDLELSALPFDSLVNQISSFTAKFSTQTSQQKKTFVVTLYGDAFYRVRPFDVKKIAQHADRVMIMAYDFHKARSNPGPNFPLHGEELYGYDLTKMSNDFLQTMPADKINVIFGYFGYDWLVDSKGNAIAQATPVTENEIEQRFLHGCNFADCVIKRDQISSETNITYTDDAKRKHSVWFEDKKSIQAKQSFLQERGINTFSYWAYSYFDN